MTGHRLTEVDLAVLRVFYELDPESEWQFHLWNPEVAERLVAATFTYRGTVDSLKRREFLGAQGRGKYRQFWITEKGVEAVEGLRDRSD